MSFTSLDSPCTQQPKGNQTFRCENENSFIQQLNQSSGSKTYFQGKCYKLDENEAQHNPKIETTNHRDLEQLIDVFHVIVDINEDETSLNEFDNIQLERTIKNDQILSQVQKFQTNNKELSKKLNDFWLKQQKSNAKINDLEDILELSSIRLFSLKNLKNMLETQLASSIRMKNHLKQQKTQNEIEKISHLIENMEKQKKITVKILEALKIALKLQKAPQQDAKKSTEQSSDYTKWFDSNNNYLSTIHKKFSSLKSSIENMGLSFLKCQETKISSYQNDVNEQQKIVQNLLNHVNQFNCNKFNTAPVDDSYKLVLTTLNIQQKTLEILQQALQQIEELKNLSNYLNNTQNKQQAQTQRQNVQLSSQRKVKESQSFAKFQSGQIQASVKTIIFPSIQKTIFQNDTQTSKQLQKKQPHLNSSQLLLEQAQIFFSETLEFVIQNHNRDVEKFLPLKEENFQSQIRSLAFEQFNKSSLQKLAVIINKNFNPNQVKNIFNSKLKQLKNFYQLIS